MTGTAPEVTSQPLKILMTADTVGGVWRYSLDLIRGLTERGAQVLLATMGPRASDDQRRQLAAIPNVTLAESGYALEWMRDPWVDVEAAAPWLLELAYSFQADVVHLNGYAHAVLPWQRPVVVVAHSCVFSWWRAVHGCVPGEEWDEYKLRVLEGLAASDIVIAPSAYMARAVEAEYGVSGDRTRVIHNFSYTEAVPSRAKEPFFLAAGRIWDPAKNILMLEQVAPRVPWAMRVSGSDCGPENSTSTFRSLERLGILPYGELLVQMARASVYVHPALYEPFGLSVLEAARAGCCLVLADIESLRELWSGSAVFVDPRDSAQWIYELNRLAGDEVKRCRWAELAHSHARRYSADCAIVEYEQVYRSLLASRHQPSSEAAA